jgi:CubicO group peptidase (beta-lactamase class C family)
MDAGMDVGMEVSSPSAQGVDAAGISAFLDVIESHRGIEPHGLIVHRHGKRIAEGYWAPHTGDRSRLVYSLSKSFTGTALGLLVGDGRLSLDDLVGDHLPELFDDATPDALRRLRIRHIASMASGHAAETLLDAFVADPDDPVRGFLTLAPDAEPGTIFAYNQPPVLTLARILERVAGARLVDELRHRVLDPIGAGDLRWRQLAGHDMGFSGVFTNLDTIARLGQLHLDDGTWNGRRILPEGWVEMASSVQTPNGDWDQVDWQQGYGFQFWMSRHGYRGDGAFGQFMVILPEQDMVVAMFSCTDDMQVVLDALWEHVLPAVDRDANRNAAHNADDALADRMANLALPTDAARLGGAAPGDVRAQRFVRSESEPSHFTITAVDTDGSTLTVHEGAGHEEVGRDGEGRDGEGPLTLPLTERWTVAGSIATNATRLDDGRITVDVAFLHTPHRLEIELDPATETFVARWPLMPLFGIGADARLASLRSLPD